jgi:hypothetical protein
MLVDRERLLKTLSFAVLGAIPPLEAAGLLEHAINGRRAGRHDIRVHHHVSQPAIAFRWNARRDSQESPVFRGLPANGRVVPERCARSLYRTSASSRRICSIQCRSTSPIGRCAARFGRSIVGRNRLLRLAYHEKPIVRLEFPIGFFCLDVLLHQFSNDFVLVDQLGLKLIDLPLLGRFRGGLACSFKRGVGVLE